MPRVHLLEIQQWAAEEAREIADLQELGSELTGCRVAGSL